VVDGIAAERRVITFDNRGVGASNRADTRSASPALYDAGHLRPLIDKTFPFDQTPDALAYVEQGRANGKAVITLG
jgi:NADPH:quinone reductase-like Zn-dependent oxidoreductase